MGVTRQAEGNGRNRGDGGLWASEISTGNGDVEVLEARLSTKLNLQRGKSAETLTVGIVFDTRWGMTSLLESLVAKMEL